MQPHVDFERDTLPRSERENPAASSSFDWDEVFAECDRELDSAAEQLEPSERQQVAEALVRILGWIFADGRGAKRSRVDQAAGRRAIALRLYLCPDPTGSLSKQAREIGIRKQSLAKLKAKAAQAFPMPPNVRKS